MMWCDMFQLDSMTVNEGQIRADSRQDINRNLVVVVSGRYGVRNTTGTSLDGNKLKAELG